MEWKLKRLHGALKRVGILRAVVRSVRASASETMDTFGALRFTRRYSFDGRSRGSERMVLVIAGYKPALWDAVFARLERFAPKDADVCVATAGKSVDRLREMCRERGWSYLSTRRNNVSLVQNVAIRLHPSARWIYKMDEDIFLTEGVFGRMMSAYLSAPQKLRAEVGFVSPLIPVNGYGHVRLLLRLGLESAWESRFGRLMYTDGLTDHTSILSNPSAARFMWGETEPGLRGIDALNALVSRDEGRMSACPYRYSIGFVLFERAMWEKMECFYVPVAGTGLGLDEEQLCQYCMLHAKAMVVAEDAVVGHFSYGPQTASMLDYMKSNAEFAASLMP